MKGRSWLHAGVMAPVGPYHHRMPCALIYVGEASFLKSVLDCLLEGHGPTLGPTLLEGRFARSHGREPQTSERRVNRRHFHPRQSGGGTKLTSLIRNVRLPCAWIWITWKVSVQDPRTDYQRSDSIDRGTERSLPQVHEGEIVGVFGKVSMPTTPSIGGGTLPTQISVHKSSGTFPK
jgi:hypothetical protein